ncbi:MAG: LPS export ABC transporter permease LptF [Alphaproteobacteria bacterium]|nr:LPS export ABC transporter permease LptF [Alphaproteobacteria bacterium]
MIFLNLTLLTVPSLLMILAPVALMIAVLYTLNRLNGDSELIVMGAAGTSPGRLLKPFIVLIAIVMMLTGLLSLWAMPNSFRAIRDLVTKIRADVLTRIVREGQFIALEQGFIFHYRERGAGGSLRGIFIQDRRDGAKVNTYISESGATVDEGGQNYLILDKGVIQRQERGQRAPAMVQFEKYAIDLAQFGSEGPEAPHKPRERYTSELLKAKAQDAKGAVTLGRLKAELHDRISAPLYALALGLIGFAALAHPRTTRQGRGMAVIGAVLAAAALRIAGFGAIALVGRNPRLWFVIYLVVAIAAAAALVAIFQPRWWQALKAKTAALFARRAASEPQSQGAPA